MGTVVIHCPATGSKIPTGIRADRLKFACSPVFFADAYCPVCDTLHLVRTRSVGRGDRGRGGCLTRRPEYAESSTRKSENEKGLPTPSAPGNRDSMNKRRCDMTETTQARTAKAARTLAPAGIDSCT